ncbi:MAG: hypothetical protein ACFE8L_01925 [Candidatus Hodarchaeota archaeon]
MSENSENSKNSKVNEEKIITIEDNTSEKDVIEKDFIPHFFPTYRIRRNLYSIPIIIVVFIAGLLAYLTYVEAGVQVEGGYFSESEFGALGGLLNGLIYTGLAVVSAFVIIYFVKRKGIDILRFIFGISFSLIGFFQTWFFGQIIIFLIFYKSPVLFYLFYYELIFLSAFFTIIMLHRYFTSVSINTKNFIVLYIGLLIGASMGVLMPLWTTLAILIGISCWDIYAVLSKKGPIKQMIDLASNSEDLEHLPQEEQKEKIKSGELIYDTSKLEIGIGDLAFYSMLTSSALVQTNNIFIMLFTAIAILIGTGITITGLKRNKILPGLPISIFLGIGMMLISWYFFSIL